MLMILNRNSCARFVARREVAVAQGVDAHPAAGRGRVHETAVADVDADMRKRPVQRVEEDQIARQQPAPVDRPAEFRDVGGAVDTQACGLFEDVGHHSAAPRPASGFCRRSGNRCRSGTSRRWRPRARAPRPRARRRYRHAAAGGEQQGGCDDGE